MSSGAGEEVRMLNFGVGIIEGEDEIIRYKDRVRYGEGRVVKSDCETEVNCEAIFIMLFEIKKGPIRASKRLTRCVRCVRVVIGVLIKRVASMSCFDR